MTFNHFFGDSEYVKLLLNLNTISTAHHSRVTCRNTPPPCERYHNINTHYRASFSGVDATYTATAARLANSITCSGRCSGIPVHLLFINRSGYFFSSLLA